jgi:hypothetical protein
VEKGLINGFIQLELQYGVLDRINIIIFALINNCNSEFMSSSLITVLVSLQNIV